MLKLLGTECGIANNSNWPVFVYDFFKSDREKLIPKLVLRGFIVVSKHLQTICFWVFGYPDKTLVLVLEIVPPYT